MSSLHKLGFVVAAFWPSFACADPTECPRNDGAAQSEMTAPATMPSMKMDEPMKSGMAKPDTPMMDVTRGAAAKDDCMQPMLKHEEKMMEQKVPGMK